MIYSLPPGHSGGLDPVPVRNSDRCERPPPWSSRSLDPDIVCGSVNQCDVARRDLGMSLIIQHCCEAINSWSARRGGTPETGETRVVRLITQRSRVQIPPPATSFRRSRPFPIRERVFCVLGTVVKGVVGAGLRSRSPQVSARLRAAWRQDGGDGLARMRQHGRSGRCRPPVAGCLARRSYGHPRV